MCFAISPTWSTLFFKRLFSKDYFSLFWSYQNHQEQQKNCQVSDYVQPEKWTGMDTMSVGSVWKQNTTKCKSDVKVFVRTKRSGKCFKNATDVTICSQFAKNVASDLCGDLFHGSSLVVPAILWCPTDSVVFYWGICVGNIVCNCYWPSLL